MIQVETDVRDALKRVLPRLPETKKAYLLGFLEGMAEMAKSGQDENQPGAAPVDRPKKEGKHGGNQSNKKPADCHGQRQD